MVWWIEREERKIGWLKKFNLLEVVDPLYSISNNDPNSPKNGLFYSFYSL